MMEIKIDWKADAAYVRVSEAPVARTQPKSDQVIVDYDAEGGIRGIELLDLGLGVDLSDVLPRDLTTQLERLLDEHHIKTFA